MSYQEAYIAKLPDFEGNSPWLYLDARKINGVPAPLITVGIGCAIGIAEALILPFTLEGTTPPLTAGESLIAQHYNKVRSMAPGKLYTAYKYPGCLILPPTAVVALVKKRLAAFEVALLGLFPDFLAWPQGPQIGAMDLIYGMGASGIITYHNWRASCARHDWRSAASQCEENAGNPAYDARNNWRRQQFLSAAK